MILCSGPYTIRGEGEVEIEIPVPRLFRPIAVASSDDFMIVQSFRLGDRDSIVVARAAEDMFPDPALRAVMQFISTSAGSDWRSFEKLFAQMEHPFLEKGEKIRCKLLNASCSYVRFSFDVLGVVR